MQRTAVKLGKEERQMAQLRFKDYLVVAAGTLLIALSLSLVHVNRVEGAAATPHGAAPVTVLNTPLPVLDVDNPARQPFQTGGGGRVQEGNCPGISSTFAVPASKRLVIEFASASVVIVAIGQIPYVEIQTEVGSISTSYRVPLTRIGAVDTREVFEGSQQMRVYADPETTVYVNFGRSLPCTEVADFRVSISGYFVNLP
jgi:hypothetical protein